MKATTRSIFTSALAADETISKATGERVLSILDGGDSGPPPLGRVIRTAEAARLCAVTPKTLRLWALAGRLVPVYGGQNRRRVGYTELSIRTVLSGN